MEMTDLEICKRIAEIECADYEVDAYTGKVDRKSVE